MIREVFFNILKTFFKCHGTIIIFPIKTALHNQSKLSWTFLQSHILYKERIAWIFFTWSDRTCQKVKVILWTSEKHTCQTMCVSNDPKLWVFLGQGHSRQMDKYEKGITPLWLEQRDCLWLEKRGKILKGMRF